MAEVTNKPSSNNVTMDASVVLLDIEGTTTSISFVKDELFPYITRNLEAYLSKMWDTEETQNDVDALYQLAKDDLGNETQGAVPILDKEQPKQDVLDSVVANVKWQMGNDRKSTALKQLQGHMWASAYEKGEVKGHLYSEVAETFKKWHKEGLRICIYSSGSVAAQKLLFKYSVDGDLTKYIEDYFDTKIGPKRQSESYIAIADRLKTDASDILFLTDIYEEAEAAKEAGLKAALLLRPGNKPLTKEQRDVFTTLEDFSCLTVNNDLDSGTPVKRAKLES